MYPMIYNVREIIIHDINDYFFCQKLIIAISITDFNDILSAKIYIILYEIVLSTMFN